MMVRGKPHSRSTTKGVKVALGDDDDAHGTAAAMDTTNAAASANGIHQFDDDSSENSSENGGGDGDIVRMMMRASRARALGTSTPTGEDGASVAHVSTAAAHVGSMKDVMFTTTTTTTTTGTTATQSSRASSPLDGALRGEGRAARGKPPPRRVNSIAKGRPRAATSDALMMEHRGHGGYGGVHDHNQHNHNAVLQGTEHGRGGPTTSPTKAAARGEDASAWVMNGGFDFGRGMTRAESSVDVNVMMTSSSESDDTNAEQGDGASLDAPLAFKETARAAYLRTTASAVELRDLVGVKTPPQLSHIGGQERAKQREKPQTREEQRGNLGSEFVEAEYAEGTPDWKSMSQTTCFKDFVILRELGRGLCGTVYLAKYRATDQLVAFKVMRKQKLIDVGEIRHAVREREIHARVNQGPFIDKLLHAYQDRWALYLVLEYAPCGDLFQAMNYHGLPSLHDAKVYTTQCALAIEYIHQCGYVYRDLKPENILLDTNGCVRLADFGMAKRLDTADERAYTICGTAQYMSPEVLTHRGCRFEADLWALGILIYELCSGGTPFGADKGTRQELYRKLMNHQNATMTFPTWFDQDTCSIVKALLHENERARLGANGAFTDIYAHPWFAPTSQVEVLKGLTLPRLQPRRRNIVYDMKLRESIASGDIPWECGSLVTDLEHLTLYQSFGA